MDWAQVLAIVLPVMLAVTIGIFYNNRRLDDVNRRIDDNNHRIDHLRLDMNERFGEVNQRLSDVREDIREIRIMLMEFIKKETMVTP